MRRATRRRVPVIRHPRAEEVVHVHAPTRTAALVLYQQLVTSGFFQSARRSRSRAGRRRRAGVLVSPSRPSVPMSRTCSRSGAGPVGENASTPPRHRRWRSCHSLAAISTTAPRSRVAADDRTRCRSSPRARAPAPAPWRRPVERAKSSIENPRASRSASAQRIAELSARRLVLAVGARPSWALDATTGRMTSAAARRRVLVARGRDDPCSLALLCGSQHSRRSRRIRTALPRFRPRDHAEIAVLPRRCTKTRACRGTSFAAILRAMFPVCRCPRLRLGPSHRSISDPATTARPPGARQRRYGPLSSPFRAARVRAFAPRPSPWPGPGGESRNCAGRSNAHPDHITPAPPRPGGDMGFADAGGTVCLC